MKKFGIIVVALAVIFILSTPSFAATNGWHVTMGDTEESPFDTMGVWWQAGDKFNTIEPGDPLPYAQWALSNFNYPSWSLYASNSYFGYATGDATKDIMFDINFATTRYATDFLFMTSSSGQFVSQQEWKFTNFAWTFTDLTPQQWIEKGGGGPVATPEPVSSALFLLGGAALAIKKRETKV